MVHTSKTYIRGCSLVDAAWLQDIQPEYFRTHRVKWTFGMINWLINFYFLFESISVFIYLWNCSMGNAYLFLRILCIASISISKNGSDWIHSVILSSSLTSWKRKQLHFLGPVSWRNFDSAYHCFLLQLDTFNSHSKVFSLSLPPM